jgi:glycerol-3-phosphate dehydrogenase
VDPSHIIFRISGVRPLAQTQAKNAGQITRDHHIQEDMLAELPVYSLVGGKWTSYRAFSEQVTDKTLAFLGAVRKKGTASLPIGGGRNYPQGSKEIQEWLDEFEKSTGIVRKQVEVLFRRYGTRAKQVAAFMKLEEDAPIVTWPNFSRREILYLVQNEKILHLDDLLLRRTLLAYLGELSLPLIEELADATGTGLDWDKDQTLAEVNRALAILKDSHGVEFGT